MKLKVLDLFSGIGGFSLGLERAGMETVAFCEIATYPRMVLQKHWPSVPIYNDIRQLNGDDIGAIDVICGGYPCQPFSEAGRRHGEKDHRHLWPEMLRLLLETKANWLIAENVTGHITMGLDTVLSDLEANNYTATAFVIPAASIGANHKRERVWIVAYANDKLMQTCRPKRVYRGNEMVKRRLVQKYIHSIEGTIGRIRPTETAAESGIPRVNDGVPNRVDRNRALGNTLVPQIPEIIGRAIMKIEFLL